MQAGKCATLVRHGLLATALAISATPVLAAEAQGGQVDTRSAGQPVTGEAATFPPEKQKARPVLPRDVADVTERANSGIASAQFILGVWYATGKYVAKDERQAVFWTRKAADQGFALAQFHLGLMYVNGQGVAKDERQAVFWYRKAAAQGHTGAIDALSEMQGANRSERAVILETKSLVDFLPAPPDARDLSHKYCRNEPARMTDRSFERTLLSSGALEILGDWVRKHYAPGRTRQDCPKINQYNTLIAWNYTLGTGNYSGAWTNEDVDRFITERKKAEMAMAGQDASRAPQAQVGRSKGETKAPGNWRVIH